MIRTLKRLTNHDLRTALIWGVAVIAAFFAIGYAVGQLTRPANVARDIAPATEPIARIDAPQNIGGAQIEGTQVPGWYDLYVNDYRGLLSDEAERNIRNKLSALYDQTGIEMTVLTIASVNTWGHPGPIEPFATDLFNTWGIGNASHNDGVLVLVARDDRWMRIEIGSGYAKSWDARMQRVIDDGFLPYFRDDRYEDGIVNGVDETIRELTGAYPGQLGQPVWKQGWSQIWHWVEGFGLKLLAILAVPLGFVANGARRYLRNRPRKCDLCNTMMLRAGEEADDEHLDGGQKLEEYLKSVDYDVWHCPSHTCGHMVIKRYGSWFTSLSACPECGYRTLSTETTILSSATTTTTGLKRLDYSCAHCGHTDSETRTIPKKSKSSSGSSRSSFGGGSSSGGGASGSW